MWYQKVLQIFKIPDLRKKIIFVLFVLAVFRLMANIPMPGLDASNLESFFNRFKALGLLSVLTGGALSNFSIIMLGLGPYITAVIILQLLTMIFPQLEKIYKEEGEAGKKKFNQWGRVLTIPLAVLQSYAMLSWFQRGPSPVIYPALGLFDTITAIITITAGTVFLMWLGELITEKGIGNGVSILIFAGIIAGFPMNVFQAWQDISTDPAKIPNYILFFVMSLVIIMAVVLITEGRRNIPISYAKRVRGNKMYGGVSTYLPLNINPAGVMPIIFAMSILIFPEMIVNFLGSAGGRMGDIAQNVSLFLANPWVRGILYFLLVVLFTYFYTAVTFDPKQISQNLQRMGGFVPGIRPGDSTAKFIHFILNRVLLIGAIFLGMIAVMPSIVGGLTGVQNNFSFLIGGTSLLIVVSVVLETMRQINSQLQMRDYETF
ncbi:MAG: preprotein translocase subunit SecY [Candidatus Nealsonbacteria bacterium RIFOXYB1_FULL_40_15]|uniref:Protein translocase subunit SecY n=2 Tax=Candidatus Nealsoniibacteriota TaxID=1817911 RepID=A0A1G2ELL3_9BACT|nr:MAG: preprotein translocase subunit SecY [Candidatus Nealsonbacteria bacterium RIFOXYC1_FULL_40_7]OGZ27805.1 MAG: preprotein translocase subunit SecY [Candidatus Nealsonbacteria bacterium RIFOXYB1_FULL_40_15]OGZ28943.1 MAG: preprotein translocase subunit SecY [Candidatus Nealsonbacteria bacterium RIFOXYD1_FULL_39_11]